jgi:aldehyde dehydrogenase (NAD(P)+)
MEALLIAATISRLDHEPPSDVVSIDDAVERLNKNAAKFARLSLDERIALARSMQRGYAQVAAASVKAACEAKGIPEESRGAEWAMGPWIAIRSFRQIIRSLESLKQTGNTRIGKIGRTFDGRLSVNVFPANALDSLLFAKVKVDVHLARGVTNKDVESRARFYRQRACESKVVAILAAGNVEAIVSLDIISKMFTEGKTCLVKLNPVNAYLGPYLEQAFREPIMRGFLAFVYGGAEQGAYLAHHPGVDEVHLTGSKKTYDALVWGPPGYERELRKARREPALDKPVTAELGNVSPVIVVPGQYSDEELRYQAEEVAAALAMNASYSCCAPKILVTARNWPQRDAYLRLVAAAFERTPTRQAYYPGAIDNYRLCTAGRERIRKFGEAREGVLPWALITDLDPDNSFDPAFICESFCPALFETALDAADTADFLTRAVDFANERLWGTLNATLVVPRRTDGQAVEWAIGDLRYGVVAVNAAPAMVFALGAPPWGAYPGSDSRDIQSGNGFVHNAPMLEGIEKVVMRHPLTTFPKPAYFPSHRTAAQLMPKLTALDESASWLKAPGVVATALRC